ncbi:hypothetical protein Tco_0214427 [Tanacetum coccineum]
MVLELATVHFSTPTGLAEDVFCEERQELSIDVYGEEDVLNDRMTQSVTFKVGGGGNILKKFSGFSERIDDAECDLEKDILLLEAILNSEPLSPLPIHANCFPEVRKELKICEAKTDETSIDEPPEVELKDLPPHRSNMAFFGG